MLYKIYKKILKMWNQVVSQVVVIKNLRKIENIRRKQRRTIVEAGEQENRRLFQEPRDITYKNQILKTQERTIGLVKTSIFYPYLVSIRGRLTAGGLLPYKMGSSKFIEGSIK